MLKSKVVEFTQLEKKIKYKFKDRKILEEALTHKSYMSDCGKKEHNERLEFLGDGVLGSIVSDLVFSRYKDYDEGLLSRLKAYFVSRKQMYLWAKDLNLGAYLLLSPGEMSTGGKTKESILSNAMEALIGAIYLDAGYERVKKIIQQWMNSLEISLEIIEGSADYKSYLQQYYQKQNLKIPKYTVIQTVGPEHDKIFTISVSIDGKVLAKGKGKTVKLAQQECAKIALEKIGILKNI